MLRELEQFVAVATAGTFTAAARRVHLSQPALTAAIQRLEHEVGAPLFDRGRHGATLTAAGRALVPRAQAALAAFADGKRAVAEIEGLAAGEVRIGGGATVCTYVLPPILARFRRARPGIRLGLREGYTDELEQAIEAGTLDLAVVTIDRRRPAAGSIERLGKFPDDDLIVVGAPDCDPRTAPWITFAPGSPTRALLLERVPQAAIVMELGSIAAVKGHVRAGIGLALLSRRAVETDLARGSLVEVPLKWAPVRRRLGVRHRGARHLTPAATALLAMLR
ncbi:MAG: LysR family transcriptional regulator [Myxococcales bacterium]|nr:LysR family transcriptional regulator [Myxococcales bacterium]